MAIRGGNIGAMDVLLTIQQPIKTYDSLTNEQLRSTWADVTTVWAERLFPPVSGEKIESDQQVNIGTYKFRMRYVTGLTTQMRLKRGTEYNYIVKIDEGDRATFLLVTTERRENANDGTTVTDVLGTSITFQDEGVIL